MPHFIYFDPVEYDPALVIARHEAAHGALAYYYGFELVHFRTLRFDAGWTGAVGVDANHIAGNLDLMTVRVRQLVAGELSARLYLGIDPDVLTLPTQGGVQVGPATPLADVWNLLIKQPRRDMVKAIELIQTIGPPNWWQWLWDRHSEAQILINTYNRQISKLARRLQYALEQPRSNIDVGIGNWIAVHCLRRRNAPGQGSFMTGRYITRCLSRAGMQKVA